MSKVGFGPGVGPLLSLLQSPPAEGGKTPAEGGKTVDEHQVLRSHSNQLMVRALQDLGKNGGLL